MKNHHRNNPIHPKRPTHDEIAVGACLRWIELGQPENAHEAIWLEAEQQLLAKKL